MRLVVTSALILSIACSTLGYLVTQPRADDRWRCGEKRTISWDWVSTDAKSFCIELSDGRSAVKIASNIARERDSIDVRVPQVASTTNGRLRVNLVACPGDGSQGIYAQSGQLDVTCRHRS